MIRRVRNKKGFTLVELLVVMGIIAVLLTLSFSGYFAYRRQMFVENLASQLQTDIRDTFVKSISVNDNAPCPGSQAAKVRSLKIPVQNPFTDYYITDYCDSSGNIQVGQAGLTPVSPSSTITPSNNLSFNEPAKLSLTVNGITRSNGFLCLVYSSPYGEFSGYYYPTPTNGSGDQCDSDVQTYWKKQSDGVFIASPSPPPPAFSVRQTEEAEFMSLNDANINSLVDIYPSGQAAEKNQ